MQVCIIFLDRNTICEDSENYRVNIECIISLCVVFFIHMFHKHDSLQTHLVRKKEEEGNETGCKETFNKKDSCVRTSIFPFIQSLFDSQWLDLIFTFTVEQETHDTIALKILPSLVVTSWGPTVPLYRCMIDFYISIYILRLGLKSKIKTNIPS